MPSPKPFLDDYDIKREVQSGSMSKMFVARHRRSGEIRAIKKVTPKSKESLAYLRRELGIALELEHPRIARCFGYQRKDDSYYILMEYVRGVSFRDYLKEKIIQEERAAPFLPYPHFMQVFREVASGLKYIHARDVLHLDIKPENLMFIKPLVEQECEDVGGPRKKRKRGDTSILLRKRRSQETRLLRPDVLEAKIIDFGVAVRGNDLSAAAGGSVFYVAPEVLSKPEVRAKMVGPRSDIYSLGSTMYEVATGRPPFLPTWFEQRDANYLTYWAEYTRLGATARRTMEMEMIERRSHTPANLEAIPYHFDCRKLIGKCLEVNPSKRYVYVHTLMDDIDRVIANISMGRK